MANWKWDSKDPQSIYIAKANGECSITWADKDALEDILAMKQKLSSQWLIPPTTFAFAQTFNLGKRQPKKHKMVSQKEAKDRNAGRLMRKAAEVLKDRNWVRNTQGSAEIGMCILGALNFAYCGNAQPKQHTNALVTLTNQKFCKWFGRSIPNFNDHMAKDKAEVIETMLKFANEFDPQGGAHD